MVGASAIIVKTCDSCPTGAQHPAWLTQCAVSFLLWLQSSPILAMSSKASAASLQGGSAFPGAEKPLLRKGLWAVWAGARADNYFLAAQDSSGVVPGTGKLLLSELQAARSGNNLTATFTLHLRQDPSALNTGFPVM